MACGSQSEKTFSAKVDFGKLPFLTKLEKDLQCIFDDFQKHTNGSLNAKDLPKNKIFLKGDYSLSLRNNCSFSFHSIKEELIQKLNTVSYIRYSEVDEHGNLFLYLKRSVVDKIVLNDVCEHQDKYGMENTNKSYLILVHNETLHDWDALRVALVADHLASFLIANGAKVFTNNLWKHNEISYENVPTFMCTDECAEKIKMAYELIENSAKICKWRKEPDSNSDCVVIDSSKYGSQFKAEMGNIKLSAEVVSLGAYITHLFLWHGVKADIIVNIGLDCQKNKISKTALLMEMLDLIDCPEMLCTCQNVLIKDQHRMSVDLFIESQKRKIVKAITHKYSSDENSDILQNEICKSTIKILVDTALKFDILKTGVKSVLKINSCGNAKNDGIFIQYNFARLSKLFKLFELKVEQGLYDPLPPLDKIDFELLKLKEERNLVSFVLSFPQIVQEVLSNFKIKHIFHGNRICIMLTKLCRDFSLYYRRTRILRGQSQKVMYARLWLLKSIHQIIRNSFILLNIQGLNQM